VPALTAVGEHQLLVSDSGGDGIPVVLLHPGITDSRIWDRLAPLLGERRLIRYDRPGYGGSPRASVATHGTADLLTLLDVLDVERAHLVGNSRGGSIALAMTVLHPERVASCTALCSPAGGYPWPPEADDPELEAEFAGLQEAHDVEALTDFYLRIFALGDTDPWLREQMRATTDLEVADADLAENDPPVWDRLDEIVVPVAMVVGDRDERASIIGGTAAAEAIPGAELVHLDTAHLPEHHLPEETAAVVLRTIGRAES